MGLRIALVAVGALALVGIVYLRYSSSRRKRKDDEEEEGKNSSSVIESHKAEEKNSDVERNIFASQDTPKTVVPIQEKKEEARRVVQNVLLREMGRNPDKKTVSTLKVSSPTKSTTPTRELSSEKLPDMGRYIPIEEIYRRKSMERSPTPSSRSGYHSLPSNINTPSPLRSRESSFISENKIKEENEVPSRITKYVSKPSIPIEITKTSFASSAQTDKSSLPETDKMNDSKPFNSTKNVESQLAEESEHLSGISSQNKLKKVAEINSPNPHADVEINSSKSDKYNQSAGSEISSGISLLNSSNEVTENSELGLTASSDEHLETNGLKVDLPESKSQIVDLKPRTLDYQPTFSFEKLNTRNSKSVEENNSPEAESDVTNKSLLQESKPFSSTKETSFEKDAEKFNNSVQLNEGLNTVTEEEEPLQSSLSIETSLSSSISENKKEDAHLARGSNVDQKMSLDVQGTEEDFSLLTDCKSMKQENGYDLTQNTGKHFTSFLESKDPALPESKNDESGEFTFLNNKEGLSELKESSFPGLEEGQFKKSTLSKTEDNSVNSVELAVPLAEDHSEPVKPNLFDSENKLLKSEELALSSVEKDQSKREESVVSDREEKLFFDESKPSDSANTDKINQENSNSQVAESNSVVLSKPSVLKESSEEPEKLPDNSNRQTYKKKSSSKKRRKR